MAENKRLNEIRNDPKQRMMFMVLGGVVVVGVIAALYFSSTSESNYQPAATSLSTVPDVPSTPGGSNSAEYNRKVQEQNAEEARRALAQGNTSVPVLTSRDTMAAVNPIDLAEQERERKRKEQEDLEAAQQLAQLQEAERKKMETPPPAPVVVPYTPPAYVQQAPVKKPKYSNEDYIVIAALMKGTVAKEPNSEFNYMGTEVKESEQQAQYAQQNAQMVQQQNTITQQPVKPVAKTGDVLHAVLETAVNSDEPSPVLARIVSGPLKGTKVVGSVQTVGKKVVLQFSSANVPQLDTSIKISAVAIDPETSRSALASDVDNHYFARYGVLIASTFLSGYAEAIAENNTTTTVGPLGNVVVTPNGQLDSKDINRQALGAVGTELANNARQNTQNIKPTITVDSGIAIGLLLMEDFSLTQGQ